MASGSGCGRGLIHYGDESAVLRGVLTTRDDELITNIDASKTPHAKAVIPWMQPAFGDDAPSHVTSDADDYVASAECN